MIDLTGVEHHPVISEIVDVLCAKTQNTDRGFFNTEVAFFACKIASVMRAEVITKDRGAIPVNMYALNLATSGFGKGHSVSIMEEDFLPGFEDRFMKDTTPLLLEQNLWLLANDRALRNQGDPQEEYDSLANEAKRTGVVPFTFDSGTVPAVKQLRHKLLMQDCGAINLQIDEIGSNLEGSLELFNVFLELYDQGRVKGKLTKNTAENTRSEEIKGKTPANLLMFGTPAKLLDGAKTEEQFYSLLDTGYARRCLFGIGHHDRKAFHTQTPEEIYERLTKSTNFAAVTKWAQIFHGLADAGMHKWKMDVPDPVAIKLIEYKAACEKHADEMKDHEEIRKAECSHRYFKALKLAGAFAFIDKSMEVTMDHLLSAILLVEESGEAFQSILNREKTYVKLAKFMASVGVEQTHADLLEVLPFYPKANGQRMEMMNLATAWGYPRHILIKKTFVDGIEFFRGETLKETNVDEMLVAYSDNFAYDYKTERAPFEQLHKLMTAPNMHWTNHGFRQNHRKEENVVEGFNMIVLDVDGGTKVETAQELLKEYKHLIYTTKRHTDTEHRFRVILPLHYNLQLDSADYKEFMNSVMAWLPFATDEASNQRAKKWMSHEGGQYFYNDGVLFDPLPFIPKTTKNEQFKEQFKGVESLDNLQRWFAQKIAAEGNRNNNLLKYGMMLVDNGYQILDVNNAVLDFNKKLKEPLPEDELSRTILVSVARKFQRA